MKLRRLLVTRSALEPTHGHLIIGGVAVPCALGRSSITRQKREGDGATPAGRFRILGGFFRADHVRRAHPALKAIRRADGWCDGANSRSYNQPIRLPSADPHEQMWRADHLYDYVLILDYNIFPVRRGRGSAIFFHLATQKYSPTAGCVAIKPQDMRRLLPRLAKNSVMVIR